MDEDGEPSDPSTEEGGKYWRLQLHWPATAKSSISTIKIDPVNSQTVSLLISGAMKAREVLIQGIDLHHLLRLHPTLPVLRVGRLA